MRPPFTLSSSKGERRRASTGSARTVAIVVAGGVGRRLKSRVRKPFIPLGGRPMLAWALRAVESSPEVDQVVVVAHRDDLKAARRLARTGRCRKVAAVVPGGVTRMKSVACGLRALPASAKWVLVHDAARPLVTPRLVRDTVRAARRAGAAIAAVPVVPTIKEARAGWVRRTLDRRKLWAVQTPQVFERKLLERAHRYGRRMAAANGSRTRRRGALGFEATDDAALVEALGRRVRIVEGDPRNVKVTTREDLVVAETLLRKRLHADWPRI